MLNPAFNNNNIPIVFSTDNQYAPYLGVTIKSLIDNASSKNNYDIVILESSISNLNKFLIRSLIGFKKNFSIRFIDVKPYLINTNFHVERYFSVETYYRLFIPTIMNNYNKVVYLDCDIIILDDIAELYNTDIQDYLLAATHNCTTIFCYEREYTLYGYNWKHYLENILKLTNPLDYFQAGVLVMNVTKMKEENIQEKTIQAANNFKHVLVDQDVLNKICHGRIKFISQSWDLLKCDWLKTSNFCSEKIVRDYAQAEKTPKIVHYAGDVKVWLNPFILHGLKWWKYAFKTIFISKLLKDLLFFNIKNFHLQRQKIKILYDLILDI